MSGGVVSDGYTEWRKCARRDCDLEVVRPGKVQCKGERDLLGCPDTEADLLDRLIGGIDGVLKAVRR